MGSFESVVELAVPVSALWGALKEQNTLFPKLLPEVISSMEEIEGVEGHVGSVRIINFVAPAGAFVKEKLIGLDLEGDAKITTQEIEGGHLSEGVGFTKWVTSMTIIAVGDDKCKVHVTTEYEGGSENAIPGVVEQAKGAVTHLFKAVEGYIKDSA